MDEEVSRVSERVGPGLWPGHARRAAGFLESYFRFQSTLALPAGSKTRLHTTDNTPWITAHSRSVPEPASGTAPEPVHLADLLVENATGLHVLVDNPVLAEKLRDAFAAQLWLEIVRPARTAQSDFV